MEIPRAEPCRLPGASGLHKCAGTQPLHQDLSLSGEGAGSALAPRGRCSPLLVWIAWLSKGFLDLDLSYHRTLLSPRPSHLCYHQWQPPCHFKTSRASPPPRLFLHWSQIVKDSEACQTNEAKLLCWLAGSGMVDVLLSLGAHFPLSMGGGGGSGVGGERGESQRQQSYYWPHSGEPAPAIDLCGP